MASVDGNFNLSPPHTYPNCLKSLYPQNTHIYTRDRNRGKREEKARETEIKTEAQTKYFTVTFSIIDKS